MYCKAVVVTACSLRSPAIEEMYCALVKALKASQVIYGEEDPSLRSQYSARQGGMIFANSAW